MPYADLEDPQSLNLYQYMRNNPLSGTDPDGHCCDWNSAADFATGALNAWSSDNLAGAGRVTQNTAPGRLGAAVGDFAAAVWGEANVAVDGSGTATAQILMEALGNTIGNRYLSAGFPGNTSWQTMITATNPTQFDGYAKGQSVKDGVDPELDAASDVFAQSLPIVSVESAQCFFSPDSSGWTAIQQAQATNATTVPSVNHQPGCYGGNTTQYMIKTSTGS